MNETSRKFRTLNRIDLFFMIAGLIEIFCLAFLGDNRLLIIIGLITIITAFIPIKEDKLKWNYFVGIWALLKYNPLGIAAILFLLSDLMMSFESTTATIVVGIALLITGLCSLVMGIILIVKTSKYLKIKENLN